MVSKLLLAWALMALCVVTHAAGVTWALRWVRRHPDPRDFWRRTWLFIRLAGVTIFFHLIEIGLWGFFYVWKRAIPDLQSAFYFSAVTYTTTGYGDIVLPEEWRMMGAFEALTGILMCGWSTGFFFAVVSRMFEIKTKAVEPTV